MKKLIYLLLAIILPMMMFTSCNNDDDDKIYKVTFNSQGGSDVEAQYVTEGEKVTKPTDPTRAGYIFGGWYESSAQNLWNFSTETVQGNITLYALWIEEGKAFIVTFETNGGSTVEPQTVAEGGRATRPLPPTKDGVAFDDWYSNSTLTNLFDFDTRITSNITIYAKWTTIDKSSLITLIDEAHNLPRGKYTYDSYENLMNIVEQAQEVVNNPSATQQQIQQAYTAISNAIEELEEVEYRPTVSIEIDPLPIDGVIYVVPGENIYIYAYGKDIRNSDSSDNRVVFSYDDVLEEWAQDIYQSDNLLQFVLSENLTEGATINIVIRSADVYSVATTVTLKVTTPNYIKTQFLQAVAALPQPNQITYDDLEKLRAAYAIYEQLPSEMEDNDPEVKAAVDKLEDCIDAYWEQPEKVAFKFSGNTATLTLEELDGTYTMIMNYSSTGSFPIGMWLSDWEYDYENQFMQHRLIFEQNNTVTSESRYANNAQGTGASAWKESAEGTYTFEGNQSSGGYLYVKFDYHDNVDYPDPKPNSSTRAINANSISIRNLLPKKVK